MKIAVIGQSLFGQEVYKELKKDGHTIVGVFTIPDKDGKADPLGENFTGTSRQCIAVGSDRVTCSECPSHMFGHSCHDCTWVGWCQMTFGLITQKKINVV